MPGTVANLDSGGHQRTAQDKRKDGRYAGRARLAIAADRSADSLCGFVENAVMPGSLIVTDDWSGYASLRKRGYDHHAIAECGEPEVAEQFMPMIHLVFSNLKTWLNGIHHGVSAKHLQAYLNEFTFRFNRRFYPFNAFRSLLGIAGGVEAPTYADLYSGAWTHPTSSGCLRYPDRHAISHDSALSPGPGWQRGTRRCSPQRIPRSRAASMRTEKRANSIRRTGIS